jgi:hypothetical protein
MISANGWSRRGLLAGTAILTAGGTAAAKEDRLADGVVILIDSNEPYVMGHAISYSANLSKHFADRGARLLIEVVANGKGIDVFRADRTRWSSRSRRCGSRCPTSPTACAHRQKRSPKPRSRSRFR